jgi:hypothetical protein
MLLSNRRGAWREEELHLWERRVSWKCSVCMAKVHGQFFARVPRLRHVLRLKALSSAAYLAWSADVKIANWRGEPIGSVSIPCKRRNRNRSSANGH